MDKNAIKKCCLGKNRADRPCFTERCGIRYLKDKIALLQLTAWEARA